MLSKLGKKTIEQANKSIKRKNRIPLKRAYSRNIYHKTNVTKSGIQVQSHQKAFYARQSPQAIAYGESRSPFPVAAVFGCNGLIGRYIVCELARVGYQVITPYRHYEDSVMFLRVMGDVGQIVGINYKPDSYESIMNICARADIVVNAAGMRGNKLFDFSPEFADLTLAKRIAHACADTNVSRMIHISHQGVSPTSDAENMRNKYEAEQIVKELVPHATIIRPNLVMGPEDRFLNMYGTLLQLSPNVPLVAGGKSKIQPVFAPNIGDAVVEILRADHHSSVFELSGPETMTHLDVVDYVAQVTQRDFKLHRMNYTLSRMLGALNELTWKPTFTRDYVSLISEDLVKDPQALGFEQLGISPAKLHDVAPDILSRFNEEDDPHRPPELSRSAIKGEFRDLQ